MRQTTQVETGWHYFFTLYKQDDTLLFVLMFTLLIKLLNLWIHFCIVGNIIYCFILYVSTKCDGCVSAGLYVYKTHIFIASKISSADADLQMVAHLVFQEWEEHRQMDHLQFTSWQSPIFPTWAFSSQFCLNISLLLTIFYKHINLSEDCTLLWGPPSLESIPLHIIGNK